MRLLITTQAVDENDPVLGFFVGWINELAKQCESIEVICLKEGSHQLASNVSVHSLGKPSSAEASKGEGNRSALRLKYILQFYLYIFSLRHRYDAVLVHMNQEYVLLGGVLWRLMGKRVYLWRNHWAGTVLTDIAAAMCTKVFCTSRHSYTAKYKKTVLMPIGVDTNRFKALPGVVRIPRSILFLARMAPSKRPDMLFEALLLLQARGIIFTASFVGSPLPADETYYRRMIVTAEKRGMKERVTFKAGIPNAETPAQYCAHDIFVNLSRSGMYDKTIVEAALCGALVVASSDDYAAEADPRLTFKDGDVAGLAKTIEDLLIQSESQRAALQGSVLTFAHKHDLSTLGTRLMKELSV